MEPLVQILNSLNIWEVAKALGVDTALEMDPGEVKWIGPEPRFGNQMYLLTIDIPFNSFVYLGGIDAGHGKVVDLVKLVRGFDDREAVDWLFEHFFEEIKEISPKTNSTVKVLRRKGVKSVRTINKTFDITTKNDRRKI